MLVQVQGKLKDEITSELKRAFPLTPVAVNASTKAGKQPPNSRGAEKVPVARETAATSESSNNSDKGIRHNLLCCC